MAGSIVSGQVIARTGKYRKFPIIGSVLMVAALALFSRIGADTPLWQTMLVMALMGLGLGGNMQPVITAAQNAANPREIGVATSTVTFFRSMGGTVGAAVFLSVLFSLLPEKIKDAFTAAQSTPEFQAAARANPAQLQVIEKAGASGSASAFNDTSFVNRLADALAHPFKVGFSDSMSIVFTVAAAIMVVGFIVILFLPEVPLRSLSAAQQRAQEDAQDAASSAPGTAAALATSSVPATSPAGHSAKATSSAPGGSATPGPRSDVTAPGNGSSRQTVTPTTPAATVPVPGGNGLAGADDASPVRSSSLGSASADGEASNPAPGAHAGDGVAAPSPDHAPHHAAGAHEATGEAPAHNDVEPRHSR